MKVISGELRRVTDPAAFIASWTATKGKPKVGHAPWGRTPVRFVSDFPDGKFSGGFMPPTSLKAETNAEGEFKFEISDAFKAFRGQIVAYQETKIPAPLPNMPPLPVLNPIYRSEPFKVTDIPGNERLAVKVVIYVFTTTTPDALGVTQATVDKEVEALRKKYKIDKLRATILSDRISVKAEERDAELKFSARVRGSTSAELGQVIAVKAGEMDIDLPGPDFITTLCVDEEQIESQIRGGLKKLSEKVSGQLLDELGKKLPPLKGVATVSVWQTRHVQTGTRTIKIPGVTSQKVPVYSVVPDAALGVPRKLF